MKVNLQGLIDYIVIRNDYRNLSYNHSDYTNLFTASHVHGKNIVTTQITSERYYKAVKKWNCDTDLRCIQGYTR